MPAHRLANRRPALPDELRTARLILRAYHGDEVEAVAVFAAVDGSRARLREWLEWVDDFRTLDHARDYCRGAASDRRFGHDLYFGLYDRTGAYLGNVGLHNIDWEIPSVEIGYWLRDDAEGRGYAAEAVAELTRFAFDDLGCQRVEIRCDPRNARSRRLAERLGFTYEGTLRNSRLDPRRRPRDTVVYALIPSDGQGDRGTDGQ